MSIGRNLKQLRNLSGKTQQEVSDLLEIDRTTYLRFENEQREPSLKVLKQLSELYNVPLHELVESALDEEREVMHINSNEKLQELQSFIFSELIQNGTLTKEEVETGIIEESKLKEVQDLIKKSLEVSTILKD